MKYIDDIFETMAENWDEKHCVAFGILFVLLPWLWFETDEDGIPRRWESRRAMLLEDLHYYYAGQALMFGIIVIIIFFLFGLYCIL